MLLWEVDCTAHVPKSVINSISLFLIIWACDLYPRPDYTTRILGSTKYISVYDEKFLWNLCLLSCIQYMISKHGYPYIYFSFHRRSWKLSVAVASLTFITILQPPLGTMSAPPEVSAGTGIYIGLTVGIIAITWSVWKLSSTPSHYHSIFPSSLFPL